MAGFGHAAQSSLQERPYQHAEARQSAGGARYLQDMRGPGPGRRVRGVSQRITDLGGEVLEPRWLGSGTPHRVVCRNGYETDRCPATFPAGNAPAADVRGKIRRQPNASFAVV
jgi:hypothetical protein